VDLESADKVILPGIGHFQNAMQSLASLHLTDALNELAIVRRRPILGICLGMQLMAKTSEEGNCRGLGWIDAHVVRLKSTNRLKYKIPHVGWNQIVIKKESSLMHGIAERSEFYFVHSYRLEPADAGDVLSESSYDGKFTSAVERGNLFGVQYHPEKSHEAGETLLKNFARL